MFHTGITSHKCNGNRTSWSYEHHFQKTRREFCSGAARQADSYRNDWQDLGNFDFGYDIKDGYGNGNFRRGSGDAWGNKWGSYGLKDVDGRYRIVNYVADKDGFRAKIDTNEPGTSNRDRPGVIINGPDGDGIANSLSKVESGLAVPPLPNKDGFDIIGGHPNDHGPHDDLHLKGNVHHPIAYDSPVHHPLHKGKPGQAKHKIASQFHPPLNYPDHLVPRNHGPPHLPLSKGHPDYDDGYHESKQIIKKNPGYEKSASVVSSVISNTPEFVKKVGAPDHKVRGAGRWRIAIVFSDVKRAWWWWCS